MAYKAPQSDPMTIDGVYRMLAEVLPVAVLVADANGRHIYVNEVASRMTGYSVDELMAGVWMVHPDDKKAWNIYQQALREGTDGSFYETRYVRKDRTEFWASVFWRSVKDEHGRLIAFFTFIADITEFKAGQDALRRADERYRVLAENSSDLFWEMELDGTFSFVSPAVRRLGYEPEEWVGHHMTEFLPADEQPVFLERLRADTVQLGTHRYEVRALRKDGSEVWMEVLADFVIEDGKPVRIQGASRDITERRAAEEALRQSEQKYKGIVENSSDLITLIRPDGTVSYASPACRHILGYEPEELMEKGSAVLHPDDRQMVIEAYEQAHRGQPGTNLEHRVITKSGETRWISLSWSPVFADGRLQTIVNVSRDITERKQAEEALRQAHAELEEAYRFQSEFINNVTHEVRTPLTAVKGYAEMLLEGLAGPVSDEQAALLKKVLTSSDHLLEVVNGVLRIARLRSGKAAVNPKVCDPRAVVEKCVSAVMPQALQKGLAIAVNADDSTATGVYDEERLITVVTNLLSNAVKFSEAGTIEVLVSCCASGAEIVVVDPGIGISDADIDTIFDEFVQLSQPHRHKPAGFGIGLAIVAAMIETMGASLTVSSATGVGTAFALRVPVLDAEAGGQTP